MRPLDLALVALGGALGALLRFAASSALPRTTWPIATAAVNLIGSFLLGYFMLPSGMDHGPRLFLAVGLLGSFTTLSTFSFETVDLWRSGHVGVAIGNIFVNGIGGPLLALLGWRLAV